jgi:hypothetical protein
VSRERRLGLTRRAPRRSKKRSRAERDAEVHRWKASLVRDFVAKHGWSKLRADTVVRPGVRLFDWVHARRTKYRTGKIADWLVAECESIPGWSWDPLRERHQRNLDNLRAFVKKRGWQALTMKTVVDGVLLAQWAITRRREYQRGVLAGWMVAAFEAIPGWEWDPIATIQRRNLLALRGHVARHGWDHLRLHTVSRDGIRVGKWANHVRTLCRKGSAPRWLCRRP